MIQLLSVFNDWYVELSWSPDVWDWLLLHWAAECCCKVKMFPHQNELFLINTSHNSVKVWPSQIQNKTCMSGTVPIRIWIHFFIHIYTFLYILFMFGRLLFQLNFQLRFQSFDEDNLLSNHNFIFSSVSFKFLSSVSFNLDKSLLRLYTSIKFSGWNYDF